MTLSGAHQDQFILREFIQREIETINAYVLMLDKASEESLKRLIAHAILEEKEHVAEGMQLLGRIDAMQGRALAEDHLPHLADDGPGARALAEIEAEGGAAGRVANAAVPSAPSNATESTTQSTPSRPASPAGGEFDPTLDAPDAPPRRRASDATTGFTVGSLRGKPQED